MVTVLKMKQKLNFPSKIHVKSERDELILVEDPEKCFTPTCYRDKCLSNLLINMSFGENFTIFLGTCRKKNTVFNVYKYSL